MKDEKGSVILETSLILPIVVLAMLAFAMLVRYFVVYETMQHGMYETTREMSAYYYLYAAFGLEDFSNDINSTGEKATASLSEMAEPFNSTIASIRHISTSLSGAQSTLGAMSTGDVQIADLETLSGQVDEIVSGAQGMTTGLQNCAGVVQAIAKNPLQTLTYLLQYVGRDAFEWGQNSLMNLIGQALMSKHIPGGDLERYTQLYGVSDMNTAMAWNSRKDGDVEMMVSYKFSIPLFNGYDFLVTQKTTTKGWGCGV